MYNIKSIWKKIKILRSCSRVTKIVKRIKKKVEEAELFITECKTKFYAEIIKCQSSSQSCQLAKVLDSALELLRVYEVSMVDITIMVDKARLRRNERLILAKHTFEGLCKLRSNVKNTYAGMIATLEVKYETMLATSGHLSVDNI